MSKGEKNGMYGKHHLEETKEKMSKQKRNKYNGKNHPKARRVAQYDLNENLIRIWDYSKQIAEEFGWNYDTFRSHLNGKCSPEYKGFIWKYIE